MPFNKDVTEQLMVAIWPKHRLYRFLLEQGITIVLLVKYCGLIIDASSIFKSVVIY